MTVNPKGFMILYLFVVTEPLPFCVATISCLRWAAHFWPFWFTAPSSISITQPRIIANNVEGRKGSDLNKTPARFMFQANLDPCYHSVIARTFSAKRRLTSSNLLNSVAVYSGAESAELSESL